MNVHLCHCTALRDEWRDGLRAIIADANNGRACGAEQAAVNYPVSSVFSCYASRRLFLFLFVSCVV